MPVEQKFFEEEDQQQQVPGTLGATGGVTPVSSTPSPATDRPEGSGRFRSLQRYITANKPAVSGMTERLGRNVQTQAEKAKKGIQEAQSQFQEKIQPEQQRLFGDEQVAGGEQVIEQAYQDPTQFVQDPEQMQRFAQLREATGGYQQIQAPELSQQRAMAQQATQAAQGAQTETGRFNLLRQTFGRPQYTTGQQRLDQLLLQTTPSEESAAQTEAERLAQMASGYTEGLPESVSQFQTQATEQLGELGEQAQTLQQQIAEQFGRRGALVDDPSTPGIDESQGVGAIGELESALQARLSERREAAPEQLGALQEALSTGQLTQDQLKMLGLQAGQNIYNLDLAKAFNLSPEAKMPTLAGIADPEEYQRYQALEKLMGRQATLFGGAGEEDVGEYSPYDFDQEAFQQALADTQQRAETAEKEYQDYVQSWAKQSGVGKLKDPEVVRSFLDNFYSGAYNTDDIGLAITKELGMSPRYANAMRRLVPASEDPGFLGADVRDKYRRFQEFQPGRTIQLRDEDQESGNVFNIT